MSEIEHNPMNWSPTSHTIHSNLHTTTRQLFKHPPEIPSEFNFETADFTQYTIYHGTKNSDVNQFAKSFSEIISQITEDKKLLDSHEIGRKAARDHCDEEMAKVVQQIKYLGIVVAKILRDEHELMCENELIQQKRRCMNLKLDKLSKQVDSFNNSYSPIGQELRMPSDIFNPTNFNTRSLIGIRQPTEGGLDFREVIPSLRQPSSGNISGQISMNENQGLNEGGIFPIQRVVDDSVEAELEAHH